MKKLTSLFVMSALLLSTLLAGCSAGGPSSPAGASGAQSGGQTTLTLGIWDKNQEAFTLEMCEAYEAANPNINIEVQLTPFRQGVGEYWTKLEAAAIGGTAPDVFWCNGLHAESYQQAGIMLDLQPYVEEQGYDLSVFPQAILDLYSFDGHLYAIPKDFDTNAVWYNKEIFDAANVPYPTDDWTWEDMVETARQLTDAEAGIYGLAAPMKNQVCYYNTVFGAGGYILSEDRRSAGYNDPKTIEGIQVWLDLLDEGLSPSFATLSDTSEDAMFLSGQLAMSWAGSYRTPEYLASEELAGKIDCVEAPSYNGNKANVMHGIGYAVYNQSKNLDEAVKFALWLGSEEAQAIQGKSGVVISAHKNAQALFAQANPEVNLQAYLNQASIATPYPCCIVSAEIFDAESRYLKQAYSGERPLQQVCNELQAEVTAILEKAG